MATNRVRLMAGVLSRTLSESSLAGGETDGELLTSFADRRNPLAFAELVHRHGPMVLGVCSRVLRHRQDAEDAFQATFLVLARKAAAVSPPNAVGTWLYGVALQTAVRARSLAMKRREREVLRPHLPEPAVRESGWDDLAEVLDEELGRLPSHYRAVIVLCDVEGRTRADAAAHLGCPEGSVSSRLSRARSMLAKRLTKRGVTLSAGALALLIGQNATTAGVPASIARLTVEAVGVATAGTVVSGGISPAVATLTEGVLKAMLVTKLKAVALPALVLGLVVLGGAVGFGRAGGQDPPKADARPAVKAPTKTDERPASAPAVKAPPAMTYVADPDPVAALRELVKQSEGANQTWTYEADDKKWYRARVTARSVTVGDVTRTDSLITPFRGVIHWEGETLFSKPFATEGEASKAAPETAVVKDPGDWRGEFEFRDGRWHFVKAQYWQDARPGMKLTTPLLSPTRLHPQYWRAVFERRVAHNEIQGVWKLESSGTGGRTRAATDADIRLTVTNEHCIWQERGQDRVSSYRLDPEKSPMHIDLTSLVKGADEGKVGRAIYRIEDDVLTICEPADAASPRPTRFSTDGKAGAGRLITVYKRVTTAGQDDKKLKGGNPVEPAANKAKEKEAYTAWGERVGSLQVGLGFRPGEQRAYSLGEALTLVVRVRNVGTEKVEFQYLTKFFTENPPTVTGADGKSIPQVRHMALGFHEPEDVSLAPGKEIELASVQFDLLPASESGKARTGRFPPLYVEAGQVSLHYERVVGNTSSGAIKVNPDWLKLSTAKLKLEIKGIPLAAPADEAKQPTPAEVRAKYAGKAPDVLTIAEPVEVGEAYYYKDGGTVGVSLTDAKGTTHLFCLDGRSLPTTERPDEPGTRNLYVGATHPTKAGAKKADVCGPEESALYGVMVRWVEKHPQRKALYQRDAGLPREKFGNLWEVREFFLKLDARFTER